MGTLFLYAIKSAICLGLLYLPYTLLMRKDTFFSFNRKMLLGIILISLILPFFNIKLFDNSAFSSINQEGKAIIEIGTPTVVREQHIETVNSTISWADIIVLIYIIGVVACLIVKVIQMICLTKFIPSRCLWTNKEDGITVYCHAGHISSFCWMNKVVISEDDYENNPSVLIHEKAHIRKGHSWDSILTAIMEVLQWFNPCVWMLDYSLKEVHEYEADDVVLSSGTTAKNYQLLLIKKAISSSSYTFANGFNHSLLKKRISMMTKNDSNKWGRTKALYLLPMAMIALGAFATTEFTKKAELPIINKVSVKNPNEQNISDKNTEKPNETSKNVSTSEVEDSINKKVNTDNEDVVFQVCEVMPSFPGGMEKLLKFIGNNVKYPEEAKTVKVEGRVIVEFIVDKSGKVRDPKVLTIKKPDDIQADDAVAIEPTTPEEKAAAEKQNQDLANAANSLKAEAIRVIESMPYWTPGKQRNKAVNVKYVIPISFRLK